MKDDERFFEIWLLNITIGITIALINVILRKVMHYFTMLEKRPTHTYFQISLIVKIFIGQFLNSAIIPIFVNNVSNDIDIYDIDGLANKSMAFLFSSFAIPALIFFDFPYFYKKY